MCIFVKVGKGPNRLCPMDYTSLFGQVHFQLKGRQVNFVLSIVLTEVLMSYGNSVGPDQTLHRAAFNLVRHYLPRSVLLPLGINRLSGSIS